MTFVRVVFEIKHSKDTFIVRLHDSQIWGVNVINMNQLFEKSELVLMTWHVSVIKSKKLRPSDLQIQPTEQTATSELQGPWFDPELDVMFLWILTCSPWDCVEQVSSCSGLQSSWGFVLFVCWVHFWFSAQFRSSAPLRHFYSSLVWLFESADWTDLLNALRFHTKLLLVVM